jgi:predicted thioesterase
MDLTPGLEASVTRIVGDGDTAAALGSGDVEVLGTPAVVALCEAAAVKAVTGALADEQTSVGVRIDIEHLAPNRVGSSVSAKAVLTDVDGRKLSFSIEAADGAGVVARGTHARVVVDRDRFIQGAR